MLTKCEGNLPAEHKWMHKFTQQQVEKRVTIHFYLYTYCVKMWTTNESNLPAEHNLMHKFTQKFMEKRATINNS